MRTWKQERVISRIFQATSKLLDVGWKLKKCECQIAALMYVQPRGDDGWLVQSIRV